MNKQLYNNIIYNISKAVKLSLNEEIQNFNPAEYSEDEHEIIDRHTIKSTLDFSYEDFNDIVDKFKNFKISKNAKLIFYPIFSINQENYGHTVPVLSYNFYYNQSLFVNDHFLNTVNHIKLTVGISYSLTLLFYNYYNDIFTRNNIDQNVRIIYAKLIKNFITEYIKDINVDWLINESVITITCGSPEYFEANYYNNIDRNGIIDNIDKGLKSFKEILERYISYLDLHKDEFKNI